MPDTTTFFQTLYGRLPEPERYWYELRLLKQRAARSLFLPYAELLTCQENQAFNLAQKNAQGFNIYFGINPRSEQKGDKEHIAAGVALYVDIDVKDFIAPDAQDEVSVILEHKERVFDLIRDKVKAFGLPPTSVIDSGRGLQMYWILQEPMMFTTPEAISRFENLNKTLATFFRGDHVGNIDRIFRFPAFSNRKPIRKGSPDLADIPVRIIACHPERVYDLQELTGRFNPSNSVPIEAGSTLSSDDLKILEKAQNAKNGDKFKRLWGGDTRAYKSQSEAEYALCMMLAYWTDRNRAQIDRLFRQSKLYREKWDTPFNGTTNGGHTIDKVLQKLAQEAQEKEHRYIPVEFWYEKIINEGEDNERVELKIDYKQFLAFLHKNGFGLLIQEKQVQIVRLKDNIVRQTLEKGNCNLTIKHFTINYLRDCQREDVWESMLRQHGTFFATNFLTALPPLDIEFYQDDQTRCCLFFRNGFVDVATNGDAPQLQPYVQLQACIWDTHIQERDYRGKYAADTILAAADQKQPSVFARFLEHVSQETIGKEDTFELRADNFAAFRYAYSYLLHEYKDPAHAHGVLCVDNDASFEAHGRRGKTLFCNALKQFRRISFEDGRTLKADNNQFVFQSLDLDSQILFIDDAKPNFDYSILYSMITSDMAIERKRDQRLIISFDRSPKVVVTTNHAVIGTGDSHTARWIVLPFTHYFSLHYTPEDEFKQRFYVDWDAQEWQRFYDFTIDCIQEYLNRKEPPAINLATYNDSKIRSAIPAELLDYLDEYLKTLPYEVPKKTFFDDFRQVYPVYDRSTQNWFSKKLSIYCQHHGILINPGYADRAWKVKEEEGKTTKLEYLIFQKEEPKQG